MTATEFDDTWVVMPVYNEAPVLAATLEDLCAAFDHVCVVDDASDDDSAQIAAGFASRGVRLLRHPFNLGQGAALQTGITYVLGDDLTQRVVTFDADGQHRVADAVAMTRVLQAPPDGAGGLDAVLGSRFVDGKGQMGGLKRLVLRLAVAYTNLSVGLKLTDTHNGLRVLNRATAAKLAIRQNGMAHATEVLEQLAAMKASYREYPTEISYSPYAKSKGQSLLNSVNILVELLLR
ncbi:MAG: glycosyltransferase family 2 protein [Micrococcales bacterium]|nr:glycosyltransferase family 2 protein [Micrococcales bacterium]